MSEDLEQQFQTWMEEHPKSWWGVPGPERPHFFFRAGVESQQARIAELEAERDRLLEAAKTIWVRHGHTEWCHYERAGLTCDCGMSALHELITPKEETT